MSLVTSSVSLMTTTTFVLVPGYWLGGWAFDQVSGPLVAAGHHVTALTLPGLESVGTDRSAVTLVDHVDAVAAAVDVAATGTVLVAHSGAGKVASAVLDRDPAAVRRVVYLDSGPAADGWADELPADLVDLALPGWDELGASLEGLSPDELATFRGRAVPHPAAVAREPLRLADPARRQVPTTVVCCSFPPTTVAELAAAGHPMFAEVAELSDLTYVDLPTSHWPMWSRPEGVAAVLLGTVG